MNKYIAKLKSHLITVLQKWLGVLLGSYNVEEYRNRLELVGKFVYEFLPALDSQYTDKLVVEEGSYNYFYFEDGRIPKYSFVMPEKHLYIVVGDIRSASWEEARSRGIARPDWELYQSDISEIQERTPSLPVLNNAPWPKYLFIGWNDPVSAPAIYGKLKKLEKRLEGGEGK